MKAPQKFPSYPKPRPARPVPVPEVFLPKPPKPNQVRITYGRKP